MDSSPTVSHLDFIAGAEKPCDWTATTICWLQRLVLTSQSATVVNLAHSHTTRPNLARSAAEQSVSKTCRAAQNLPVSWYRLRKFSVLRVNWKCTQTVIKCCKFRAVFNSNPEAVSYTHGYSKKLLKKIWSLCESVLVIWLQQEIAESWRKIYCPLVARHNKRHSGRDRGQKTGHNTELHNTDLIWAKQKDTNN